jgi:signal transduction histidine kinase
VNDVVAGMERTLRALVGTDSQLVTRLRPHGGLIRADAAQLHRLLINLVVNARDAMPNGGVVTIETGVAAADAPDAPARPASLPRDGDYLTLAVRDTGTGMDEATRSQIFEPFFTTKPAGHGTGLGLWIVRDIVERFDGAIEVRSVPGQGTEFVVYFPRARSATGR